MSYEVQINVNGSRCKQYNHDGKLFIEAKTGSEYSIEIKNNQYQRILAVCSVDGLDILSGKPSKEESPGYVINGYNAGKFDGFRVSNEKVAKFVFDYKNSSYAASKENGSEKNVGVIGIRLFLEKVKPPVIKEIHHHHDHYHNDWENPWRNPWKYPQPIIWLSDRSIRYDSNSTFGSDTGIYKSTNEHLGGTYNSSGNDFKGNSRSMCGGDSKKINNYNNGISGCSSTTNNDSLDWMEVERERSLKGVPLGFDMGTKWGDAKESKVIEIEFDKGLLSLSTNIYYASRQSLIEMGVPLGNEKQVNFPEPFEDSKYAKPPKNWVG